MFPTVGNNVPKPWKQEYQALGTEVPASGTKPPAAGQPSAQPPCRQTCVPLRRTHRGCPTGHRTQAHAVLSGPGTPQARQYGICMDVNRHRKEY
ncbi:hypothetical protein HMPREF9303_2742 [Prevotella denticola CRIS 18C-A]|uniref:Uncharacterized protein n=1 Tax=Prevotella denticola CRIS 18C-A TaxID=944557 RepID=F0H990_9BACT|nr:hypothetical protein HMPREF9303_2742 [Prevotella denticola CRIS 18C-A]